MELSKDVLKIDAGKVADKLAGFIRDKVRNYFKRKGAVIGLSGGIDSAVAGALCVKALGKERVHGLILPERDSNPVSREYGILSAKSLGITWEEIDLTPILEVFGVYSRRDAIVRKYFPDLKRDYQFRIMLPQDMLDRDRINVYHLEVKDGDGSVKSARLSRDDYLGMIAANDIKQRTRMIQFYYAAEKRYSIVCGTTNLPETLQGFFVKYGDGGVDIEPLVPLYKDQVFQLARHLGVPKEIIDRTPSPDTYSYVVSDQEFYFCIPYDMIDLILYAMEHNLPKEEAAQSLGITMEQLNRAWRDIERKREATEPLRNLPPTPPMQF
jgi:NAD+ synthase